MASVLTAWQAPRLWVVFWGCETVEGIIAALVTGILSFAGVVITNVSSNKSMQHKLEKNQAVTDTKITELTREVRLHNGFAEKIPVIQEQIKVINHRLEDLEHK